RVSLTRTDNGPGENVTPVGQILPRVEFAAKNYADLLVSLHLNSTASPNQARGAYVLVSNGNYNKAVADTGSAIGLNILSELGKLGIQNNGLMTRDSIDTQNPNGTISDYYGIVRYGLWRSIPSMIVEHCFINNDSDCSNFLSSDAKIRALALADAKGIANYYGLEKKTDAELAGNVYCLIDYRSHWAHEAIDAAIVAGWINGFEDQTFRPDVTLTRAMFVTMLGRLSGADLTQVSESVFPDVSASDYYAPYVQWATASGIVDGFPDGTFRPDENITREQMACIMARYLKSIGFDTTYSGEAVSSQIQDLSSIGGWALDDVLFCFETGLLNGRGDCFDPQTGATRAEACVVLGRLNNYDGARAEAEPETLQAEPEVPVTQEAANAAPAEPVEAAEAPAESIPAA
ncbi:MAG: S-layer homology domain-containing protein, partial [Clostridiales bacterium]|nr:S-layer homology domain-containing protein [Clostridiales bacterium]